jgi:hypothetical protein
MLAGGEAGSGDHRIRVDGPEPRLGFRRTAQARVRRQRGSGQTGGGEPGWILAGEWQAAEEAGDDLGGGWRRGHGRIARREREAEGRGESEDKGEGIRAGGSDPVRLDRGPAC